MVGASHVKAAGKELVVAAEDDQESWEEVGVEEVDGVWLELDAGDEDDDGDGEDEELLV